MAVPTIAEMKREDRRRAQADRFESYLGREAAWWVETATENSSEAPPYSAWSWDSAIVPRHKIGGFRWILRRRRLRRWMASGGVLVLVGPPRAGKTRMLEFLGLAIIDNYRAGSGRNAPLAREDLPVSGLFAIDETDAHDRIDVSLALDHPDVRNRGFALTFLDADNFRNFEIWPFFEARKVLILELSRQAG